jgi:aryl-alcohol dehydrogenase-like predicted oxidoreductase
MKFSSRIGLGTAQFGMKYGLKNQQAPHDSVRAIVDFAHQSDAIGWVDTAAAYGDSERLLGELGIGHLEVFTKIPPLGGASQPIQMVHDSIRKSLENLQQERLQGVLIHNLDDLLGPDGQAVWKAVCSYKEQGKVLHLGVSAYDADKIKAAVKMFPDIEFVQAPLNVIDQRLLADGTIEFLQDAGVAFVARSMFLQGLLLLPPESLGTKWELFKPALTEVAGTARELGLSPLQLCLGFVLQNALVTACVIGANTLSHIQDILDCRPTPPIGDLSHLSSGDTRFIDPRFWK